MDKSQVFWVLGILAVFSLLAGLIARSMNIHAGRLRTVGVTASGTVIKILGSSKKATAYYEFITMTRSLGKGIQRNVPGQKIYESGDRVDILYLPDRPSINSITEHLESKIILLKRHSRRMWLISLANFLMLALLLFLMVKYNIIHNLF